eukprot:CAMPEP_0183602176 /NCGR_PEP_ID=MMETSP0371-20130417/180813_1 /TAXON_ID=268820 /ORGANISM="Peridinium aciculiferum, Strain PAER-2" /LENGTH=221 /DNA_ID=CAMNT_0025814271 /DNA_START=64 /DNA_END=726 /DNA_ORIENTATION=-
MAPVAAPLKRSRAVLPLAVLGASAVLTLRALSPGLLFASPEAAASRRNVLLSAALAAAALAPAAPALAAEFPLLGKVRGPFEVDPKEAIIVGDINSADSKAANAAPAVAAEFPLLGKVRGPFEVDPKEAIIVGDINSADSKAAKVMINKYLTSVEEARAALDKDEQADITTLLKPLAISEIRQATNSVNNLMDDASAAGVQRLQRLMIQEWYLIEDDIPFP